VIATVFAVNPLAAQDDTPPRFAIFDGLSLLEGLTPGVRRQRMG